MTDWLPDLPAFIEAHRYFAIWLLMWVETFFPVFPSEVVMPVGALVAAHGRMTLWGVILAGTAGAMTGAAMWYFLARALGYERFSRAVVRYGRVTTVTTREIATLQNWFDRYGSWTVLVGRVVIGARSAVSIPAGLTRMPFWRFFLLSAIGTGIWNSAMALAGWALKAHYHRIGHYVGPFVKIGIGLAVLIWIYRMVRFKHA